MTPDSLLPRTSHEGRRYVVSGRVQGVFFRASTRERALALGLTGTVGNRADGTVEIHAFGPPGRLDELERWLHVGPRLARVEAVSAAAAPYRRAAGFEIVTG